MTLKQKHLQAAVSLTVMGWAVALRFGMTVWHAFSGVIWARLLLLHVAAVWATSLANLWSRAYGQRRQSARPRRQRLSPILSFPDKPKEEGDV